MNYKEPQINKECMLKKSQTCANGASPLIINKCNNKLRINDKCERNCEPKECAEPDLFLCKMELQDAAKHLFYGDFYIIGRIWIDALKSVLLGSKLNLIKFPTVKAANKKEDVPERPKAMKATELPLYGDKHAAYKDYEEEKSLCKEVNKKIIHSFMLPYVSCARKCTQDVCGVIKNELDDTKTELSEYFHDKKKATITYLRDPKNVNERSVTVLLGGVSGYLFGYKRGIPSKILFTGLGILASGALCFPEETDENFKKFCYYSAQAVIKGYNFITGDNYVMKEKLPCKERDDVKQIKKQPLKPNVCPSDKRK